VVFGPKGDLDANIFSPPFYRLSLTTLR